MLGTSIGLPQSPQPPEVFIHWDDFEGYPLGEADGNGLWSETSPSTNIFTFVSSPVFNGSRSMYINTVATNLGLGWDFAEAHTGKLTIEFRIRTVDAAGNSPRITLTNGAITTASAQGPVIRINGNELETFDGAWNIITSGSAIADDTWHLIRLEVDVATNTFTLYLDDVKQGGDHTFRNALPQITKFGFYTGSSTAGDDLYIDNVTLRIPR